ncbi:MAG: hypothetical protein ACI4KR_05575 [Ruminiclostridium sp.]
MSKCSKEQLEEIILEHSEEDKSFRDYLKMALSESDDADKYISDFGRVAEQVFRGDAKAISFSRRRIFLFPKLRRKEILLKL